MQNHVRKKLEGGADFDVFLREVIGVDEDFADLVDGIVGPPEEVRNLPEETGLGVFVDYGKGGGQ